MANENQIQIEIVLDDGSVKQGFARIKQEAENTSSFLGRAFSIKSFTDLSFAIIAVQRAFSALSSVVKASVQESLEAEQATLKLSSALASLPGVTSDALSSFQSFSKELSSLVGIDDDLINANAALLVSLGRLSGTELKSATKAALDLSAGIGIGLEDAFRKVAIAAQGNVGQFTRLGFEFSKTGTDAEKFSQLLSQVEQRFGGLAESVAGGTFQGALNRINIAFGDLRQSIGDAITSSPALRELLNAIAEGFNSVANTISSFSKTGGFNQLVIDAVRFASAINTYVIAPLELVGNLLFKAFQGIDLFVKSIFTVVVSIIGKIADVFEAFGVNNPIVASIQEIRDAAQVVYKEAFDATTSLKGVFETPVSDKIGPAIDDLAARVENAKPSLQSFASVAEESFKSVEDNVQAARKSIDSAFQQGILRTISTTVATIGASLVRGSDAFKDFGASVLGIIGDMAINIGTTLVGIGIGIDNLKASLLLLTGAPAIAAGLALIAVGGLLKSLSGGVSGNVAAPANPAFLPPGGGGAELPPTSIEETTRERSPQQGLVVNINGDVLGDESSGRRLVELINSAFDASGVSLRTGVV